MKVTRIAHNFNLGTLRNLKTINIVLLTNSDGEPFSMVNLCALILFKVAPQLFRAHSSMINFGS